MRRHILYLSWQTIHSRRSRYARLYVIATVREFPDGWKYIKRSHRIMRHDNMTITVYFDMSQQFDCMIIQNWNSYYINIKCVHSSCPKGVYGTITVRNSTVSYRWHADGRLEEMWINGVPHEYASECTERCRSKNGYRAIWQHAQLLWRR